MIEADPFRVAIADSGAWVVTILAKNVRGESVVTVLGQGTQGGAEAARVVVVELRHALDSITTALTRR